MLSLTSTLPAGLSVKAQTSAGILSKTTTTIVQKRVAHTPTMKVTPDIYIMPQQPIKWILTSIVIDMIFLFSELCNEAASYSHRVWGQSTHQRPPAIPQHIYRRVYEVLPLRKHGLPNGMRPHRVELIHHLIYPCLQLRMCAHSTASGIPF